MNRSLYGVLALSGSPPAARGGGGGFFGRCRFFQHQLVELDQGFAHAQRHRTRADASGVARGIGKIIGIGRRNPVELRQEGLFTKALVPLALAGVCAAAGNPALHSASPGTAMSRTPPLSGGSRV